MITTKCKLSFKWNQVYYPTRGVVFSVYAKDEKEVVVESVDEFKGIQSVIIRDGKLIKPKQIT